MKNYGKPPILTAHMDLMSLIDKAKPKKQSELKLNPTRHSIALSTELSDAKDTVSLTISLPNDSGQMMFGSTNGKLKKTELTKIINYLQKIQKDMK